MRILRTALIAACLLAPTWASCQAPAEPPANPLIRRYTEGELVAYELRGNNKARGTVSAYTAKAFGIVGRDSVGAFQEEFEWTALTLDGAAVELPVGSRVFRQRLSLSPDAVARMPNLALAHPNLAGPILDLLNFYADLSLAARMGTLAKAGDRARVGHNRTNSWADGRAILVGEDAIDFDITLQEIDTAGKTATLVVRHVPPESPAIRTTAEWMRKPVAGAANNWIQVASYPPGKYTAAVGVETVDVRLIVDLATGRILSGATENAVEVIERVCEDVDATRCGEPARLRVIRTVELVPIRASP